MPPMHTSRWHETHHMSDCISSDDDEINCKRKLIISIATQLSVFFLLATKRAIESDTVAKSRSGRTIKCESWYSVHFCVNPVAIPFWGNGCNQSAVCSPVRSCLGCGSLYLAVHNKCKVDVCGVSHDREDWSFIEVWDSVEPTTISINMKT